MYAAKDDCLPCRTNATGYDRMARTGNEQRYVVGIVTIAAENSKCDLRGRCC